jgi:hypothetical protein
MVARSRRAIWFAALGTLIAALTRAGDVLPAPPFTTPRALLDWLEAREPVEIAFSLLRSAALVAAWYVLVMAMASVLAASLGSRRLVRAVDAATPRPLRRALANLAGVGITAGALTVGLMPSPRAVTAPGAGPPKAARTLAVPHHLSIDDDASTARLRRDDTVDPLRGVATMHRLEPGEAAAPARPASRPPGRSREALRLYTVQRGDHLWSIAADHLAVTLGREPTDREIDPYWRTLITANRRRLANPDDPNLLFVGQELELPRDSD